MSTEYDEEAADTEQEADKDENDFRYNEQPEAEADGGEAPPKLGYMHVKKKKKHPVRRAVCGTLAALLGCYIIFVFVNIPFIRYWRNVWIETAMTTMTHQWLAEWFFPESVIDSVMAGQTGRLNNIVQNNYFTDPEDAHDPLGQEELKVGGDDGFGGTVIVNDTEQGIIISELKTSSYNAKVMQVFDPSRVFIGFTKKRGSIGMVLTDMLKAYDAVAGVNASGFYDPGGNGTGGEVVGLTMSRGEVWGAYADDMDSICFDRRNRLTVGRITDWKAHDVRDGMQFTPVLVADGKKNVSGTAGYGLQPRTAIGQRKDGSVIILTCDGRQVGYSIGMDMGQCADIMLKYGACTAAACDGGSSTVMGYDGKILTKPSGVNKKDGRYLPNAFLIKRKE